MQVAQSRAARRDRAIASERAGGCAADERGDVARGYAKKCVWIGHVLSPKAPSQRELSAEWLTEGVSQDGRVRYTIASYAGIEESAKPA